MTKQGVRWDRRACMATDYQAPRSVSVTRPSEPARTGRHPAAGETVISVRGLRMSYGDLEAVRGIDLDVRRGEVFAFLGPNGAGKDNHGRGVGGLPEPDRRRGLGAGCRSQHAGLDWRERVGVVLQESAAEPDLTVRECPEHVCQLLRSPRPVDELIELVGLAEKAQARGATLSGGQRRRLDVALALVGDPELVFLDEPTTGFDPSARRAAWEMIAGLQALGKTIFLTTHYMEEAEYLADRIAVLAAGGSSPRAHRRTSVGATPQRR